VGIDHAEINVVPSRTSTEKKNKKMCPSLFNHWDLFRDMVSLNSDVTFFLESWTWYLYKKGIYVTTLETFGDNSLCNNGCNLKSQPQILDLTIKNNSNDVD
jgi:hypothetical protein